MSRKTLKYRMLLKAFRLLPVKQIMASQTEKTQRIFRLAYKGENIPKLNDDAMTIKRLKIAGSSVLYYKLNQRTNRLAIYLVGGGMLKFPQQDQAQELMGLAKECNMDILLPYYPIIFTGGTLPDVYAMLYALYKIALRRYKPENITFVGGSSGGNLAIGLTAYINEMGESLPQPGKIFAGSPGTLLLTDAERMLAYKQEETDVVMSVKAIYTVWEGMTGGKEVFLAGAQSIKNRLEEFGVHVTLEIGDGMYHSYAMMPFVKEAAEGHRHYIEYMQK